MDKKKLRELIKKLVAEYMGTGASGGNSNGFNNITSPRIGGSFNTEEEEMEDYRDKNVGMGARGKQTSGMVPNFGNPNRTRFTKF